MREYLNDRWYFTEGFQEEYKNEVNIETFEKVRIPHTVKEIPLNYVNNEDYQMISTYYTELDLREYQGKHCSLVFEGNAHYSEVYLNGKLCAIHKTGYTGFRVQIEEKHKEDILKVLVKLDSHETLNIPPFGHVIDYLTYGGIYRDVYLEVRNRSFIEDVFVKADGEKKLTLEMKYHDAKAGQRVRIKIADLNEEREVECLYHFENLDVELWDVENPNLYPLQIELLEDNRIADEVKFEVGFRSITSDVNGIYLNGKKIKLRGLNRHQSYAYVGYAMPERVERRDARILKYELGLNAVRTSHYPNSHDFISECDRIGLLVFTEIPGWQYIGDEEWQDIAVSNVEEMVLQYRNHPSIFMWGVRINESQDHHDLYVRTNEMARKLDDTRLIGGVRYVENSELLEDVYTMNDFIHNGTNEGVRKRSQVTTDMTKALLVTEYNGHMYPTKMIDDEPHKTNHVKRHLVVLNSVAGSEEHAGCFGWCMADYNTHRDFGSGDQICYHGVLDIFRNKKPAAHVYSSQGDGEVVLEIGSSLDIGDHPAGMIRNVAIMTNCDKVRFYQGEELLGEFYPSEKYPHLKHSPIWIDELSGGWGDKSKGYRVEGIKENKVVKELVIEKFEKLAFKISSDTMELAEGKSYDVASVRIEATNQAGNHLAYFGEALRIETSGDIELIGPKIITLKGGFGGFYVKSEKAGKGSVKVYYNEELIKELEYIITK